MHTNMTKKMIWATTLTMAAFLTMTGCGSLSGDDPDTTKYPESTIGIVETTEEYASSTDYLYIKNEDGTIAISGYTGSDAVLTVPGTVDNLVVTAIGDHAFEANWNLTSVTLPEGITMIGEGAFMDCGSLEEVIIPETVGTIRRAAFASCSKIDNLVIPASVSQILEEAFTGCASLKNLSIASTTVQYDRWGLDGESISPELVISCPAGSNVEAWANQNGIETAPLR